MTSLFPPKVPVSVSQLKKLYGDPAKLVAARLMYQGRIIARFEFTRGGVVRYTAPDGLTIAVFERTAYLDD